MAGGIVNPNGTQRKPGVVPQGTIHGPDAASKQHGTVRVSGRSYNSPFTDSDVSVFPTGASIATQPQLPATKEQTPGITVNQTQFKKVYPTETPQFFQTSVRAHALVNRAGGPSTTANTPSNPNAIRHVKQTPPPQGTSQTPVSHLSLDSFHDQNNGSTIGSHANSSSSKSRWDTVKTGAAG